MSSKVGSKFGRISIPSTPYEKIDLCQIMAYRLRILPWSANKPVFNERKKPILEKFTKELSVDALLFESVLLDSAHDTALPVRSAPQHARLSTRHC